MSIDWSNYSKTRNYLSDSEIKIYQKILQKFFTTYSIINKKMDVLEIGSGHGIYTILLSKLFKSVLATEPNSTLHSDLNSIIKKKKINNVTTKRVFAEELSSSNTFDMIVCMNVFLFLQDKQKILLKFNNLLKSKNSYLVIMEPIRFLMFHGKKTKRSKQMMETNIFVHKSKKFDLVYYGKILKPYICYILKKK